MWRNLLKLITISVENNMCISRLLYIVNTYITVAVYISSGEYEIHEMWISLPTYNTDRVRYHGHKRPVFEE